MKRSLFFNYYRRISENERAAALLLLGADAGSAAGSPESEASRGVYFRSNLI